MTALVFQDTFYTIEYSVRIDPEASFSLIVLRVKTIQAAIGVSGPNRGKG